MEKENKQILGCKHHAWSNLQQQSNVVYITIEILQVYMSTVQPTGRVQWSWENLWEMGLHRLGCIWETSNIFPHKYLNLYLSVFLHSAAIIKWTPPLDLTCENDKIVSKLHIRPNLVLWGTFSVPSESTQTSLYFKAWLVRSRDITQSGPQWTNSSWLAEKGSMPLT